MATGGAFGAYDELAEAYKDELARFGVELDLRETTEGFATLKSLVEGNGEVDAGFVKGGLVGSLQGRLASAKARDWHDNKLKDLRSVGRMFYEPLWVFTRGDLPIETLRDLEGRKIMVGTRQSGTRRVTQLLKANGIDAKDSTFIEEELPTHAHPLLSGEVDAAMLMLPADSDKIQQLLRVDNIRLMDFSPEAEAYVNRFPRSPRSCCGWAASSSTRRSPPPTSRCWPPRRPSSCGATSTRRLSACSRTPCLAARGPASTGTAIPSSSTRRAIPLRERPRVRALASEARHVYKSGELPLLLRVLGPINHQLGLPFSLTAFANAHGAQTLLLIIPMLTIVFPLMKLVPILYVEHSAPPALLVSPAQAARAQPRSRPRTRGDRRAARRNRAHRCRRTPHPRAAQLLRPVLRPARPHRSRAATPVATGRRDAARRRVDAAHSICAGTVSSAAAPIATP